MWRWLGRAVAAFAALVGLLIGYGYWEATSDPRVVRYSVDGPGCGAPPLTIALVSDTHVVLPDMPPARLARICKAVTALRPDLVVLAGDYVSYRIARTGSFDAATATAPFAQCHARSGVFAVLGNHDMRAPAHADDMAAGLRAAGVRVLRNAAVPVGGVWIAGIDDADWGRADIPAALAGVPAGAPLLFVMHNPDRFADLPPGRVTLAVAGHTHGGQIAPFGWRPVLPVRHRAWARGLVWDRGMPMVVTSGVGASFVPIRVGVPPEIALITLAGTTRLARSRAR